MKVIGFFSQKGGVGKTTDCVNVAAVLDKVFHQRVLVLEGDRQQNASEYLLSDNDQFEVNKEKYNILSYIEGKCNLKDCIYKSYMSQRMDGVPKATNIDVIPSSDLVGMQSLVLSDDTIKTIASDLKALDYDYCICDLPPYISSVGTVMLSMTDSIVVPIQVNDTSLKGYADMLSTVDDIRNRGLNDDLKVGGILCNSYRNSYPFHRYLTDEVQENYGNLIPIKIRLSNVIDKALWNKRPMVYYKPSHLVSKDFIQATEHIIHTV